MDNQLIKTLFNDLDICHSSLELFAEGSEDLSNLKAVIVYIESVLARNYQSTEVIC